MSYRYMAVAAVVLASTSAAAQQNVADKPTVVAPASQPANSADLHKLRRRVAELEKKLAGVTDQLEESELEKLRKEAGEASRVPVETPKKERQFLWGALALQKLNPEISLSADIIAGVIFDDEGRFYAGEDDRSGIPVREVGLHIQHVLDPFSLFKSAISFVPGEGAYLEEIYISWFGLIKSLSLTVGRFRQDFGVVNRWHGHGLDQVSYPFAMEQVLGPGGLFGNGISVKWFMPPLWAHANELTLQLTDGENSTLFAGRHFSVPVALLHLKNYYDLSDSTYLDLGLTGMFGFNNRRGYVEPDVEPVQLDDEPWRKTFVAGANLTLYWSPPQQAKYRSLTFRSEFYFASKQLPAPSSDTKQSAGFYSYLQVQLATSWFAGARFDLALPTIRESDELAWDIVPYLTFWQSEFVYLRLEYRHGQKIPYLTTDGQRARHTDNRLLLQIDFAAGPHKHEKY